MAKKVRILSGSPRLGGNSDTLCDQFLKGAVEAGNEVEKSPCNRWVASTASEEEARQRLEAILSDKMLWFNPYRVSDRALLDCAERGRWSPFPAVTQMMVFHFHDIRTILDRNGNPAYDTIYFHIGDSDQEHFFSLRSLSRPMTHIVTRRPVWTLINGRHLVNSNVRSLERKDIFVSHAINCDRVNGGSRQVYRMHRLHGSESTRAATVRESMCAAKISMLEEILRYPVHPDYLGSPCLTFDYATPLRSAIEAVRRFPSSIPPTQHPAD